MAIRVSAMGSTFAMRFGKAQPFPERSPSRRLYAGDATEVADERKSRKGLTVQPLE
jgi:hypothetical protein